MASNDNTFGVSNYYTLWSQTMASIMEQLSGKEVGVKVAGSVDGSLPDRLWVTFTLGEALVGEHAFSVSRADALHLGQLFMGEIPDPNAEFTPDHTDSLAELFRQFSGTVALQLKAELRTECTVRFKDTQEPEWNSLETSSLVVMADPPVTIASRIDTALLNSLTKIHPLSAEQPVVAEVEAGVDAKAEVAPSAVSAAAQQSVPVQPTPTEVVQPEVAVRAPSAPINDKNLDLLLYVPLEDSIRFGRRQMLLKDVLDLSSGVMVELDRRVQDHIELTLGGRVIAR